MRQRTGVGLVEAKAYVDALAVGRVPPPLPVIQAMPAVPAQPSDGGGSGARVFMLLLVVAAAALAFWWLARGR